MYDVITFGSATQDIYVKSKKFMPVLGEKFSTGKGICLSLGSKVEVEDIFLSSGGGGTNTAATFAEQGFKVAFYGQIGKDYFGDLVLSEMERLKISREFISRTEKKTTNTSVFLLYPGKDRTILVYRGASDNFSNKNLFTKKVMAKWFYLAPFSGKLAGLTEEIVLYAEKIKAKVAWNPGYDQLKFNEKKLKRILNKIDILILNKEEASRLTSISQEKEKEIFSKIGKMTKNKIVIITKGAQGASISDGKFLYKVPASPAKLIDSTGAGDAFGSGFVCGIMKREKDIVFAAQIASANSSSVIKEFGAKKGLLPKNKNWPKVEILKEKLYDF
jgi:sugar/nucleoside kinase (ribokinase family)